MSANIRRTLILLLLTVVISTGVFLTDAFRDDNFCRYDAPFYATIAQNIVRTGDWVNLRYSLDMPFEGNHPPLTFWATAFFVKLLGESVISVVLFSILCAVGACITVFLIGTVLKDDIVGFLSAMGLLLTRYVPRVARFNTIEIPLMLFVSLAVLFLILALKKHRAFYLLFGVCVSLSILSKGIVGVLPFGICFFMILFQKRFRDFYNPFFLGGIFIALAVPFSWLFFKGGGSLEGVVSVFKSYYTFAFIAFTAAGREDPGPRLRLITKLIEICFIIFPGVLLGAYFLIRDNIKDKRRDLLVIPVWALIFILAFMISSWRRGFYLLPMYPAMALLFGVGISGIIKERYRLWTVCLIAAFFAGNISAPVLFPHWEPKDLDDVIYTNTYFPKAKEAARAFYEQFSLDARFAAYGLDFPQENEFIFFFRSDNDIEICQDEEAFKELVYSKKPVLVYMEKNTFSRLDKKYHSKLKVVYAFDDNVMATNRLDAVPVFGEE
ncbi:MAG: glycosyltransferase family 39 protein [Candidatus Omnitrophica bacterium]|nr:glycosyltransferase family 39 protein [Candidatus Omnitrophota bacterium]